MKRFSSWTSKKFFQPLGFLLVAAWGVVTWSQTAQIVNQAIRPLDVVKQNFLKATAQPDSATKGAVSDAYGQLPLSFEANRGQTDSQVDFISRGNGYALFLTPSEAVLTMRTSTESQAAKVTRDNREVATEAVLRMKLIGGKAKPRVAAQQELPGKINYFVGKDPTRWRTGIPTYAKVRYQDVYDGVDLVYYGNQRQLEYDFVVRPGAKPATIALGFKGADKLEIDDQGNLVLKTEAGEIRQRKPLIYQEVNGVRQEVAGGYQLKDSFTVGFQVEAYDTSRPLVIDPVLVYSTYLGGTGADDGLSIALDGSGSAYVTGSTSSADFPTTLGAFDTTTNGSTDSFVTKLNPAGSALVYSTYLGGSNNDTGWGIAVDALGSAYVTGGTFSPDFPTTIGAFDTTHNGNDDAFVTKLNPAGSALDYSTYLGGTNSDNGSGIAVDASGGAYVTGATSSGDFPTTLGAFSTTYNGGGTDAFVTKLNPAGSAPLVYSTFLGGSGNDQGESGIVVDASGSAYVTGFTFSADFPTTIGAFDTTLEGSADAFVTKLNAAGSAPLVYSTFLGGSGEEVGRDLAVDASGSAYVTGATFSANFPTTAGAFSTTYNGGGSDAFVTKLNTLGSAPLVYSTFLGGSSSDQGQSIAVDTSGNSYVTGWTMSTNFPTTPGAFDTTFGGFQEGFVTKLNPAGSAPLVYSTFLGGSAGDSGQGIALDASDNAYVVGQTLSADFPTTPGAFDTTYNGGFVDAFVTKLSGIGPPATLMLDPPAATNTVDSQHCVTATVQDALGNPTPGITVRFTVTGSINTSGSATTDSNGEAVFCYIGPPLPGADTITAYADTDNDNMQDVDEPSGAAMKTWVPPGTTPLCTITVTNGGWIIAANGDVGTFGGNARANAIGATQGQEQYQDHGPVQPLNMNSINVLAIVCDGSTRASIYGQATINGSGTFFYRINVQDLAEPGMGQDTYGLLINGYDSGEQILRGGNVQIRRQ